MPRLAFVRHARADPVVDRTRVAVDRPYRAYRAGGGRSQPIARPYARNVRSASIVTIGRLSIAVLGAH